VFPLPRVFPPRREKERDMVKEKERVVKLLHVQTCTQISDEEGNCSKKKKLGVGCFTKGAMKSFSPF
jgi:hypothetical protein